MKIRFNRVALQEALSFVAGIIPARAAKPVLQCVKISADEQGVSISGTDLEIGIRHMVSQAQTDRPGSSVVPASKVSAIVRESIDEVLEFEADETELHIRGSDSHFNIYTHDVEQYPDAIEDEGDSDMAVSLSILQQGISQTLFATAKENTKYALHGVLWEIAEEYINLVGTDGRRLARKIVELDTPMPENHIGKRLILPVKAVSLVQKIVSEQNSLIGVSYNEKKVTFSCGDVLITSNLVEGNFPRYQDIIPKDNDKIIKLNTDATLSAVKRASLLTTDESRGIKVSIGDGVMVFSSRAPEMGDAQVDMPVDYSGEPLAVGFDPDFILDALKVVKQAQIQIEMGNPDRAVLFRCSDTFIYIVMPVEV
ncbi:DNA polymerase III subunit beta [Sedimentisphaera salicampi]|uniref:Beta sliding clamp n=1 Tax=Sedimentisphaera salicampi TaxID=1941349 RepID=A0A1W6LL26_9BACT|nr:DNA polymerase III subunit beta [Sedimentisphaera salicampi]ARN56455.1 DNA polymerase III subunit beta [Sedimentisphaera salicampi]